MSGLWARELIDELPCMPEDPAEEKSGTTPAKPLATLLGQGLKRPEGGYDFAAAAGGSGKEPIGPKLITPIHAGGVDGVTRHDRFGEVWGWLLKAVRLRVLPYDEAEGLIREWAAIQLADPWPETKLADEIAGVRKTEIKNYGPLPQAGTASPGGGVSLPDWDVGKLTAGPIPVRRHIVENLIEAGQLQLFAGPGGIGKTHAMLDLGLSVASYGEDWMPAGGPLTWFGEPIKTGGRVVIITTEDDKDDVHIRLKEIDGGRGLLERASGRLFVLPLFSVEGGAFPFFQRPRGPYGGCEPSSKWLHLLGELEKIPDLCLVIVDTLSSTVHGEEKPDIIQEYFNGLGEICRRFKAAVALTHHIRKSGQIEIRTKENMLEAVRGTTAIPAAVRGVIGLWHAPDYKRKLTALSLPVKPGACLLGGLLKGNHQKEDPMSIPPRVLLRGPGGVLVDKSNAAELAATSDRPEFGAGEWLIAAVERAAKDRHPLRFTARSHGLYSRRQELPRKLQRMSRISLENLAQTLLDDGKICFAQLANSKIKVLDVPHGPAANKQGYEDPGKWEVDWDEDYEVTIYGKVISRK